MDKIEKAKELLKKEGYILGSPFHIDDILIWAKDNFNIELSKEECFEIAEDINNNFNAELGINWNTIDEAVSDFIYTNNLK